MAVLTDRGTNFSAECGAEKRYDEHAYMCDIHVRHYNVRWVRAMHDSNVFEIYENSESREITIY